MRGVADFERSYAPGKWSFRKVLVHLAQTELALSTRARFALTMPGYQAQAFSQDEWMAADDRAGARAALDAYTSLREFNLALWRNLTEIVGTVLDALGLDPRLAPAPVLERQADSRSDEWVDRYRVDAEREGLPL